MHRIGQYDIHYINVRVGGNLIKVFVIVYVFVLKLIFFLPFTNVSIESIR